MKKERSESEQFFTVDSLFRRPTIAANPVATLVYSLNPEMIRDQDTRTQVGRVTVGDKDFIYKQERRRDSFIHERRALLTLQENWTGDLALAPFPIVYSVDPINQAFLMEAVPGKTLRDRLRERDMDGRKKVEFGKGLISGVKYANGLNIAHLDLNPENTLYDSPTGRVALVDWGSSGHGDTLQQCHMTKMKPTTAPSTFFIPGMPNIIQHPPECLSQIEVDGECADTYETASLLVQLFWGMDPLLQSVEDDLASLNIGKLREVVERLDEYDPSQEDFLTKITTNLSLNPSERTSMPDDLLSCLANL